MQSDFKMPGFRLDYSEVVHPCHACLLNLFYLLMKIENEKSPCEKSSLYVLSFFQPPTAEMLSVMNLGIITVIISFGLYIQNGVKTTLFLLLNVVKNLNN
jgi:hypothetical protein